MPAIVDDVILKGKFSTSMLESNSRTLGAELIVNNSWSHLARCTAQVIKVIVFFNVTSCGLVDRYQRSEKFTATVLQFATKKCKHYDTQNYNFACYFVWV
jgi:phosphotransferase system IIA component